MGCLWDVCGMSMRCLLDVYKCLWNVSWNLSWNVSWDVHELFMQCLWDFHGMFMGCLWNIYGMSMECLWYNYGMSMGFLWNVYGMIMVIYGMLQDFPDQCIREAVSTISTSNTRFFFWKTGVKRCRMVLQP